MMYYVRLLGVLSLVCLTACQMRKAPKPPQFQTDSETDTELGADLEGGLSAGDYAALVCDKPETFRGLRAWRRLSNSELVFRLNREIMLQAFACGITRVGLLQYGNSDIESDLIAEGVQRPGQRYHLLSHAGGPEFFNTQAGMMREVATLITQLKAAKIGDHSLFDETLILVASDIGDNPNGHDGVNIPALMAGRLGGKLKTGRMIEYPFIPRDWANLNNGMHWNRLLVSVAHLMGQTDVQTIGNTLYSGPLPELLG
jgi:hypothetical protein